MQSIKYLNFLFLVIFFQVFSGENIFEDLLEELVYTNTQIRADAKTLKEELKYDAAQLKLDLEAKAALVRDELRDEITMVEESIGDPQDFLLSSTHIDTEEKINALESSFFELIKTVLNELRLIKALVTT